VASGKRGGARPGAGRKKKAEKFAGPVAEAEKRISDRLPRLIDNLMKLADGGYERVEEKWVPADPPDDDDEAAPVQSPGLVLIERKVSRAEPDRAANQYLIDRVLGRPTGKAEVDVTSGGEQVQTVFYIPKNGRDDDDPTDHQASGGAAVGLPLDEG
jgi:hypothetical protein